YILRVESLRLVAYPTCFWCTSSVAGDTRGAQLAVEPMRCGLPQRVCCRAAEPTRAEA
ncbi:unnamed protein product, partial [Ectocarpus sp. 8 AP-2014]